MGYIYVMSDLHGMYAEYLRMLDKICFRPEDSLYILGDAIDRGKDGIRLLQDFMQRDNVTLLLGNHEYMMLEVVTMEDFLGGDLEEEFTRRMLQWRMNGGDVTAHVFFQELNYKEQAKIITYLENCPLMLPNVLANGKRYYLVHASPDLEGITDAITDPFVTANSLLSLPKAEAIKLKQILLWKRLEGTEDIPEHYCVIFGHTPTIHYQKELPMSFWYGKQMINIDSGCAFLASGRREGRMGCLRLEDLKEFYL